MSATQRVEAQTGFTPLAEIPADHGVVYLYRPRGIVGSGVAFRVAVDGAFAGRVRNNAYLPLTLTPGIHVFSAAPYESRWLQAPRATPTDVNVVAGQSHYVRAVWSMTGAYSAGEVEFQGVDEPVALGELASMRLSEE